MDIKQPGASANTAEAQNHPSNSSLGLQPQPVPVPDASAPVTGDRQSDNHGVLPAFQTLRISQPEAARNSELPSQPGNTGPPCVPPKIEASDSNQQGRVPSSQHVGNTDQGDDRFVGSFHSSASPNSPQIVELQSNNPFRARLERSLSDATSNPDTTFSPHLTPSNTGGSSLHPSSHGIDTQSAPSASLDEGLGKASTQSVLVLGVEGTAHHVPLQESLPAPSGSSTGASVGGAGCERNKTLEYPHEAPSVHSTQVKEELPTSQIPPVQEPPSEVYGVRIVNWTDGINKAMRQSPILVQNENGPCPLLALVNSLVMRTPLDNQSPLIRALSSRERISLGLLIQALFDELTTYVNEEHQLPDIEDLSKFLTMLHTGMNVNPRLTPDVNPDQPGKFHKTRDITLYSAFHLPLVHGWLASPSSKAHEAMLRAGEYHDDIQLLHFRKEDLEERVMAGGTLSPAEEQLIEDIDHIQRFNLENPTQLSSFGLEQLRRCIEPGSVSILFRNEHFSTLYKHPQSNELFSLVTDAGYARHADVVWESLVDSNGGGSGLFSGDFRSTGNAPSSGQLQQRHQTGADGTARNDNNSSQLAVHNEQTDADYAYALALQFQDEEEQRERERRSSRPQPQSPRQQTCVVHARSASSATPQGHRRPSATGHRQPRHSQVVRPLVPPPGTPIRQTVSADADAPPPTYEQAAQTPPYNPQAHHIPQFGVANSIAGPRTSSYSHDGSYQVPPPRRRSQVPIVAGTHHERLREKDRSKDCVVM
ncbi:hypothetical protein LOZ66_000387 [Ophidiomyces ophidiicola]|nr:hypothetical protein LOZ66_000387 [Ophidiomyces ophidiicola]